MQYITWIAYRRLLLNFILMYIIFSFNVDSGLEGDQLQEHVGDRETNGRFRS